MGDYQPLLRSRPDDWEEYPRSAKIDWLQQHRVGAEILAHIAEEVGVDHEKIEFRNSASMKHAAIQLLVELEGDHGG